MRLVSLNDSGLGIGEEQIAELFEPFVDGRAGARPNAWSAEVSRRKRKILKRALKGSLLPWRPNSRRGEATVLGEYNKAWRAIDYTTYGLGAPQRDYTPWEWRG